MRGGRHHSAQMEVRIRVSRVTGAGDTRGGDSPKTKPSEAKEGTYALYFIALSYVNYTTLLNISNCLGLKEIRSDSSRSTNRTLTYFVPPLFRYPRCWLARRKADELRTEGLRKLRELERLNQDREARLLGLRRAGLSVLIVRGAGLRGEPFEHLRRTVRDEYVLAIVSRRKYGKVVVAPLVSWTPVVFSVHPLEV